MLDGFAPPIQPGIHLTIKGGQFVIALSLHNPTDEPIHLSTMSTKLFSVTLKERTMTEEGTHVLWSPNVMAGQAVTRWELAAGGRITKHYSVPDEEAARNRADEHLEDHGDFLYDEDEEVEVTIGPASERPSRGDDVDNPVHFEQTVDPEEAGIVQVEAGLPCGSDYFNTLTKQYDLRTTPDRKLDDELPEATMDAIESTMGL